MNTTNYKTLQEHMFGVFEDKDLILEGNSYLVSVNSRGNKRIISKDGDFNFYFNKKTGLTIKYGETIEDDPAYNPFGNEIADIEIVKSCEGIRNSEGKRQPCQFCYKSMKDR